MLHLGHHGRGVFHDHWAGLAHHLELAFLDLRYAGGEEGPPLPVLFLVFVSVILRPPCNCRRKGVSCEYRPLEYLLPLRQEAAGSVHNLVQFFASPKVMLQRYRPLRRGNHINVFLLRSPTVQSDISHCTNRGDASLPNPRSELMSVWYCSGKQDDVDVFWQHDDDLFPHHTSLR